MRVALISLFVLVASASANTLFPRQSLPNCAANCLASADYGGCSVTDNKCLCNNSSFVSSTSTCIAKSCTGNDLINAQKAAQQICLSVGVTLTASSTAAASSTASGTTGAATPTTTKPSSNSTQTSSGTAATATTTKSSDARSNSVNALAGVAAVALVGLTVF